MNNQRGLCRAEYLATRYHAASVQTLPVDTRSCPRNRQPIGKRVRLVGRGRQFDATIFCACLPAPNRRLACCPSTHPRALQGGLLHALDMLRITQLLVLLGAHLDIRIRRWTYRDTAWRSGVGRSRDPAS